MEKPDNFVNLSASNWFGESWFKPSLSSTAKHELVVDADFRNLTHRLVPPRALPIALKMRGEDIAHDRKQPRFKRERRLIGVSGLKDCEQDFLADVIEFRLIQQPPPYKSGYERTDIVEKNLKSLFASVLSAFHELRSSRALLLFAPRHHLVN